MTPAFRHVDADRAVMFGPGAIEDADELLGEGYVLLTTERAALTAPWVVDRAARVVHVPSGHVESIAAALGPTVPGPRLVALGSGRVIDTAKALAAADAPREVVAIPTSLSAAEMTRVHRHATGVPAGTAHARAQLVLNDPELSGSQPLDALPRAPRTRWGTRRSGC